MYPDFHRSPLQKVVIGPASSAGVARGNSSTQLLAIHNCSKTGQQFSIAIYDAPDLNSALGGTYPPLYQPTLSAGQIIDMTILGRSFKLDFGLVAVPAGVANSDGGWMLVYA